MAVPPLHRCLGTAVRDQKRWTASPVQEGRPERLALDKHTRLYKTETELMTTFNRCLNALIVITRTLNIIAIGVICHLIGHIYGATYLFRGEKM